MQRVIEFGHVCREATVDGIPSVYIETDFPNPRIIIDINKYSYLKLGDQVKLIWPNHRDEVLEIYVMEKIKYNPKEGF